MFVDNHFSDQISAYIIHRERARSDMGSTIILMGKCLSKIILRRENGYKKSILNLVCHCQVHEDGFLLSNKAL